jgi:transposase
MYPRLTSVRRPSGKVDEYVQLAESYRDDQGRTRQRVIVSLGRKDLLTAQLDALLRLLDPQRRYVASDQLGAEQAAPWGRLLVLRQLWRELGLEAILDELEGRPTRGQARLADRVLVLVANRLCEATSEHGLTRWLEKEFVCDRAGRRWQPAWRDDQERRRSRRPRVRVQDAQLHGWYRSLDALHTQKATIEKRLFLRLRDLFSLRAELVFYDLTSTYFEGRGPEGLAAYGYSRDGRPQNRQVLVGVVRVDGWPLAHHVFGGNRRDSQTVEQVLDDVRQRFGLGRVVWVSDRGMMTSDNVALLRRRGQGYLLGLNRRRNEQVQRYIEQAQGEWQECLPSIATAEKTNPPRTRVQEVAGDEAGVRVFVVHSEEREQYERAQRERAMEKVGAQLEALAQRVAAGKLKAPAKVGAAAVRILSRHHGQRYFAWEYKAGHFRYFEHPVNLEGEKALEGKYLIQTEEQDLTPLEAVARYKELMEVERAFRDLKDVIEMRPIYHQTPRRVEAHIFVAALALLLKHALQRKLKQADVDLSAEEALGALTTVQLVDLELPDGTAKRLLTRGTRRAQQVLQALGIRDRLPPGGPDQKPRL